MPQPYSNKSAAILLIESNPNDTNLVSNLLLEAGHSQPRFNLIQAPTLLAGRTQLAAQPINLILLSLHLPDSEGLAALADVQQAAPDLPVIVLAGSADEQLATLALQAGAQDFLLKEQLNSYILSRAIEFALERQRLLLAVRQQAADLEIDERRLRNLIERNSDGILVVGPDGLIRFANPAAEAIFGNSPLKNQTFDLPLTTGEIVEIEVAQTGETRNYEMNVGETRWAAEMCNIVALRDITERKHTQEKLIAERNLLRTVINNLPDTVYVKDLNGKYIIVNLATLQHLGASTLIDIIGKTDADIYPTSLAQKYQAEDDQILRTGHPLLNQEEQIADPQTKAQHWLLNTKVPLRDTEGQVTGLVGIKRDITQRRQAEEFLKQEHLLLAQRINERTCELQYANHQLAHALRVKDEFLASMSHELRTPLNAILGMSEILLEEVYGALNDKQLNSLKIVQDSGRHLLALINDILDVSKIEADKLVLEPSQMAVEEVCYTCIRFVQQTAQKKNIKITASYSHPNLVIQADERRLKQILVNLLSNAVKFTPKGGTVGLEVTAHPAEQLLKFLVWDTGIGIAPQDVAKLFEPFVQLDSRLSREYEGTGLGLALVKLLADLHQATVTVESEVGRGSRFTVSMPWQGFVTPPTPRETPPESAISLNPSLGHNGNLPLILLAEDNLANVEVMTSFLSTKGYRVVAATDGAEAVARAKKLQPNLILMDIHMPELNGLEATRQIRAEAALAQTPIVAITALAMPGDRERCLAAGINSYLSKPVSLRELVAVIEGLLRQQSPA